ncbi:MAG: hypothetical protein M3680_26445 [Myxococcota bacterium]|nr:hypothetical protein [Myxococcota bacterium]
MEFFAVLATGLASDGAGRAKQISGQTYNALFPLLRTAPEHAIAAMNAIGAGIRGELDYARELQEEQSIRKWVQFVAETSGADSAHGSFDDADPVKRVDGLIDCTIRASYPDPQRRVEVVSTRVNGVKQGILKRLTRQRLLDLALPVRATADFGSPSASLAVVRTAAGAINYTENTQPNGRAGWLERKAQTYGRGADAAWGARMMIEEEVMAQPLDASKVSGDSAD